MKEISSFTYNDNNAVYLLWNEGSILYSMSVRVIADYQVTLAAFSVTIGAVSRPKRSSVLTIIRLLYRIIHFLPNIKLNQML